MAEERQDPFYFGERLLETLDLDPVYCTLAARQWGVEHLGRWLWTHLHYYDASVACWCASAPTRNEFWDRVRSLLQTGPRDKARRHWRGRAAVASVAWFMEHHPEPWTWFRECAGRAAAGVPERGEDCVGRFIKAPNFGALWAWKAADMMQAVLGLPISPPPVEKFYDSPLEGAQAWHQWMYAYKVPGPEAAAKFVKAAHEHFAGRLAPHGHPPRAGARPLNAWEFETMLCKWHGWRNGHYDLGEDVRGLQAALARPPVVGLEVTPLHAQLAGFAPVWNPSTGRPTFTGSRV